MKKNRTAFILILAALVCLAGFYYYQRNIYSKDILKLEILGPEQADLLQEVEYVVKYKNNGDTSLENPELVFEYPEYSLGLSESSLRAVKASKDLGDVIYPGEEKTFRFKGRLLGKEGEAKEAKASLSFKPKNLKASYKSETTFTTMIKRVPLSLDFDLPSNIDSGKDLKFRLNYFSNIDYPVPNLRVMVEYPSDFEFISSNPNALEKTEWEIGLLNRGKGGRIEITGRVRGDLGEEKVFKARIGSWQDGEFVLLKEINSGAAMAKPSLYITQQINGNPRYVASPGDSLHYQISFQNLGEDVLSNLYLIIKLQGSAFDFSSVKSPQGEFKSGDNSIVFDWTKNSSLQFLDVNEEGGVEFWINLKKGWAITGSQDKNPLIKDSIFLSQVQEDFVNKVNSTLAVSQRGYFYDDVFGNSGSLPPRIGGEPTTYTISWKAMNFYNDVNNVKIKAKLPLTSELTGKIFPEQESSRFTFDSKSREIVWSLGDLKASQGVAGTAAPNISFQIQFSPVLGQFSQSPEIIKEAIISGEDQWTGETVEGSALPVTTAVPDDDKIKENEKTVL
jgi:hypothetical protein